MSDAPLSGLRVLEIATGIAGPYAGRLMAMLGAEVVKVEPADGDPARQQPIDDEALTGTSPLFVHLNVGKTNVAKLHPRWAHLVIDDRVRSEVAADEFVSGPKVVSISPWGFDGARSGTIADELIVQAQSGFLGFNRDAGEAPLRLPGWPAQYMAGAVAAVGALALLRTDAHHLDVSWLAAFLGSTELAYADALHCERPRDPVGAHPPSSFPSGAIPCLDGFVAPGSIRAIDWEMQCLFYERADLIENTEYSNRQKRVEHIDELWDIIRPWYSQRSKREIFQYALDTPWAVGMIMTPLDALTDPHLKERNFLTSVDTPKGPVTAIGTVWRGDGLAVSNQRVSARAADPVPGRAAQDRAAQDSAAQDRAAQENPGADDPTGLVPEALDLARLDGVRIIEMSVAWAGPYVGNLLAPLGVDVVKLEAQAPFDGWRALRPYDHGMRPGQEEMVEDNRFFEASGLYNALNKGKRGCVLSLAGAEGREVFLDMVASVDAIVANFSAHVLPSLGLDWETLKKVNPGLVVVRMPAFGIDGPYSSAAGYGSIVEAMGGIGHRQGYEREGARISNIYYPDPVAGVHAAMALLAGLHRRDRTGLGGEIDMSHQEATWSLHGDSLVLAAAEGRNVGRTGNREPGIAVSGIFAAGNDRWVAVIGPERCRAAVQQPTDSAEAMIDKVLAAGGQAVEVLDPWTAPAEDLVSSHLESVDHPITGPVRHIASPYRIDGVRPSATGPAPLFDQHTDEVIAELAGYDPARLAELRTAEVIGGELPEPSSLGYRF